MQLKIYPVIYVPSVVLHLCHYRYDVGRDVIDNLFTAARLRQVLLNWRGIAYGVVDCLTACYNNSHRSRSARSR